MKVKKMIRKMAEAVLTYILSPVGIIMAIMLPLVLLGGSSLSAESMPSPESVMAAYIENPYIEFYRGSQGLAWTTVHPGASALSSYGTYVYTDDRYYRGPEGTTVIPEGVIRRRDIQSGLKPGQHYYTGAVKDSVIPVGKWVLTHSNASCIHGPFPACRDYEYYGLNGLPNRLCYGRYDSGWIAYCADCGEPITGFVYTDALCVRNVGYIFAGTGEFARNYPVGYTFVCPVRGDNLENDFAIGIHMCKSFISCNRYTVRYDGCGALYGSMPESVFYYGGSREYEGTEVSGEESLRDNEFINPGYVFAGWSDVPGGEKILGDGSGRDQIEEWFTYLSGSGDEVNDTVIKLYAVWEKCDSALLISGGSFGEDRGEYDGVPDGEMVPGVNLISRGYMLETEADPSLLTHPRGYRIDLDTMGGPEAGPLWTDTGFDGWIYEELEGYVREIMSDGRLVYVHSSVSNGNVDKVTAKWKSVPVTLPEAVFPGFVFDGWYTDPDMAPEHFAGYGGDLFETDRDTRLYACFRGLDLEAAPDYMGNESFGELRYNGLAGLSLPGANGYDLFRYYISDGAGAPAWREAVTDSTGRLQEAAVYSFTGAGASDRYVATRTGIYEIKLWGGAGASYGSYIGEKGEYSSCKILLSEGDVLDIYTGRPGKTESRAGGTVCGGGESSYITVNGETLMVSAGGAGANCVLNVRKEFVYTGSIQSYTVTAEGDYTLEVWGAEGGGTTHNFNTAGKGGYARGNVHLSAGTTLYVCVGGTGGYNGGGSGGLNAYGDRGGSGGGATHIAGTNGLLRNLYRSQGSVYLVAGGGGGSGGANAVSGAGGGNTGGTGISPWSGGEGSATGGTQTGAGSGQGICAGGFGYGGNGYSYVTDPIDYPFITNGGGGGGWYGGGGGAVNRISYGCGGGGGSGYIGGVKNGTMTSGVCSGNGHALITASVNIRGLDATGGDTSFDPGGHLYRDHTVTNHSATVYPADDTGKMGYCIITEPAVRYYGSSGKLVCSPDKEAPDAVEDGGLDYDPVTGRISVFWSMPEDNGSIYSYMARAYRSEDMIGHSDDYVQTGTRTLCITTGVYGYYWLADESETAAKDTVISKGTFIPSSWAGISGTSPDAAFTEWYEDASVSDLVTYGYSFIPDGGNKYIHLVAADRAGNTSGVFDMAIDGQDAYIPYPVETGKLLIQESEFVYPSPDETDTYFVRADPETPFMLGYSAHINGFARDGYQIDEALFCQNRSEYAQLGFPNGNVMLSDEEVIPDEIARTPGFYPVPGTPSDVFRTDHCRILTFTEIFSVSYEGEIFVYPAASAHMESGEAVMSDTYEDIKNGLTLIGDATAPECFVSVNGGEYEKLSECNISNTLSEYVIDRRLDNVSVEIYVRDELSGLRGGFEVWIRNTDNGIEDSFFASGDRYCLDLKMNETSREPEFENMLFNGNFVITVTSADNVGNTRTDRSACLHELDVTGSIHRCLDELTGPVYSADGEPVIKRGESGYVLSEVWGYPDAVLVSFENEKLKMFDTLYVIGDGNVGITYTDPARTVTVNAPEYLLEECTSFTVPLDYDSDVIRVSITAFKGEESLTWNAQCAMAEEGTVLDELYTVLR